jgi:tetratricopeptide (TPR) repeat protein
MAANITSFTELLHRFHTCELYVKQGKIATCLLAFKEIMEKMPSIPMTDKEKKELHGGIAGFLKNIASHKKIKELFGDVSFSDTDLETNMEFLKSMIVAQEQDIVDRYHKDEETAEAQRLEIQKVSEQKKEDAKQKVEDAIKLIDEGKIPQALEITKDDEEMRDNVVLHYNSLGMQNREIKNFDEAVKNYTKAISVSPQDENLYYNMARAYFEAGKQQIAEGFLGKALKINPEFKEGKTFFDYLAKLNQAKSNNNKDKNSVSIFKKIFYKKISN